ncbi:retrotransposon protein, putative, ty1-copia subclass [Tanacetum coccineum]
MHVIEQPLPPAPQAGAEPNIVAQWTALYDAHTEIACLMLGSMTPELHRQFEVHYPYDMIQELKSMFEKQAENYNMHNMGKTIGEIHAMLIEYEKGLPKKAETPQVMMIKSGKIQKANKKSLNAKGKNKDIGKGKDKRDLDLEKEAETRSSLTCTGQYDESFDKCESCLSGKMTKKPFPHSNERAKDLLGIIHTDVCGPLRHVSRQDRWQYISPEIKDYLKANGIVQQLTPPYTPQHNRVSERRNRTLLDMVRSMMNLTTLPLSFWDYALESATRILNMVPTKKVDKTPYELWYGKVPNLSYLKVWGCEALVKRDTPDKLEQRSVKCIFIGYPKETMGYYFYFPPENKIVVARYAEFFEKRLISQEISGRAVDLEEIQEEEDTTPSEKITSNIPQEVEGFEPPQEEVIPIRRSERPHRAPNRLCLNVEVEEHSLGDLNEPASYKAAMLDSEFYK